MVGREDQLGERVADRAHHHFTGADQPAPDHHDFGVQQVHQVGDAECGPPTELAEHRERRGVAV